MSDAGTGFYGKDFFEGKTSFARSLNDLQYAIGLDYIRLAKDPKLRIFLEGCRCGMIGETADVVPSSFVTRLSSITGRTVISACGASEDFLREDTAGLPVNIMRSYAAKGSDYTDGLFHGWIEGLEHREQFCTTPALTFSSVCPECR
jgi:hypothetical protein